MSIALLRHGAQNEPEKKKKNLKEIFTNKKTRSVCLSVYPAMRFAVR